MKKKMRKWLPWIVLAAVAAGGLGGYGIYNAVKAAQPAEEAPLQTARARLGDLEIRASGTGRVVASREMTLGFSSGGELVEVLVQVGDEVEEGQLLARVDDSSAQAQVTQAEMALRELTSPLAMATAQQDAAKAEETYETALEDLKLLISPAIFEAEQALAEAQANLTAAQAAADADPGSAEAAEALTAAQQAVQDAQSALEKAQHNYEVYYAPQTFSGTYVDRRTGKTIAYDSPPTDLDILNARAAYALAQARLGEAQALLAALNGEELPADASGAGLAKLEQARMNLESAQQSLDETNLYAPFAGVVTAINGAVGERVSGSFLTLDVLRPPIVEFYLDETDLDKVAVGLDAEITLDALPDDVLTGHVIHVDPMLTSIQGVATVRGLVQIDTPPTKAGFDPLPTGLSAAVDVIAQRVQNAVIIPVEALRELGPGEYAVFVMRDGELQMQQVEVALMDYTYAAITSGLQEGDVVSTGIVETQQ
jgi:HlyD family secretion protein